MAALDQQLGRDMALLCELSVVQRRIGRFEVGAAVLLVGIEEKRIKPPVEVVMAGDVVSGTPARIELLDVPDEIAKPPLQLCPTRRHIWLVEGDRQHVGDRSLFDDERAIHVDFAKGQFRIEQKMACGCSVVRNRTANRLSGAVTAGEGRPVRGGECDRAPPNEPAQKKPQQTVHRNHLS